MTDFNKVASNKPAPSIVDFIDAADYKDLLEIAAQDDKISAKNAVVQLQLILVEPDNVGHYLKAADSLCKATPKSGYYGAAKKVALAGLKIDPENENLSAMLSTCMWHRGDFHNGPRQD